MNRSDIESMTQLYVEGLDTWQGDWVLTNTTTFNDLKSMNKIVCFHVSDENLTKENIYQTNFHVGNMDTTEYRADYLWGEIGTTSDQYILRVTVNLDKLYPELYEADDPYDKTNAARSKGYNVMAYLNLIDDYDPDGSGVKWDPDSGEFLPAGIGDPPLSLVIFDPSAIHSIEKVRKRSYSEWLDAGNS